MNEEKIVCSKCGNEIKKGDIFCNNCGKKIKKNKVKKVVITICCIIFLLSSIAFISYNMYMSDICIQSGEDIFEEAIYQYAEPKGITRDDIIITNIKCENANPYNLLAHKFLLSGDVTLNSESISVSLYYICNYKYNAISSGYTDNNIENKLDEEIEQRVKSKKEEEEEIKRHNATFMTAKQLYKEYDNNEINADDKYKDEYVMVSGIIYSIGVDFLGNNYIILKTSNTGKVQCFFDDDYVSYELNNLKKNKKVTLTGKVEGKTLMNVLVEDCEINLVENAK